MSNMAILVFPATAVVIGLIIHSLRFRGGRDTIYFFVAAAIFGMARGNVIWWITTVHFESKFPYIFRSQLIGVYHDSLTADAGWIICLYLGSYLALLITEKLPEVRGRLFPMMSLACLFNACLSYAVEATAMTMGWWQWNLSTRSSILSDVPMVGIVAWFSVGFDFLIPYYTIRHYRRPGQWWPFLTLLIFPVHMCMHLFGERVSDAIPMTPYNAWHWAMLLAVMCLPFVSRIKMRRPWLRGGSAAASAERGRLIPVIGLFVVVAVLLLSDLVISRAPWLLVTKLPLASYALVALLPLSPLWILAGTSALAAVGGKFFVPTLIAPVFYYSLKGMSLWKRQAALKAAYVLVPLVLTGIYYNWSHERHQVDKQYGTYINNGLRLAGQGELDEAIEEFLSASRLKPNSLPAYENLSILYSRKNDFGRAESILRKMLDLRPLSEEIHANMGNVFLLKGDLDEAERWFNKALAINPTHEYSAQKLRDIEMLRAKRSGR